MEDRIAQAKSIDMVTYLSSQGFNSVKEKGDNLYYLSPFREEGSPSFCVSISKNTWVDFGRELKRKDVIDFVQEMEGCDFNTALDKLLGGSPLAKHEYTGKLPPSRAIEVVEVQDTVTNTTLIDYIELERKIPIEVVNRYCQQVGFRFANRGYITYFGIGMVNDSGGWSIRSTWFKGATSPANYTIVKAVDDSTHLSLFEGMVDWLSYVVLYGEPDHTCIILNSLVYIPMLLENMKTYSVVHGWLDNDHAADEKMELLQAEGIPLMDHRETYKGYGDINEYLQKNFDI